MRRGITPPDDRIIRIDNIEEMEHLMELLERLKMIEKLFTAFSEAERNDPARQEAYAEVANNIRDAFADYFNGIEWCDFPVHAPDKPERN